MIQYTPPYGHPIDLNMVFYYSMATWVGEVITEGGPEPELTDPWPQPKVSYSSAGFQFELKPIQQNPPSDLTIFEVIETLNIFQRWAIAWANPNSRTVPSAMMEVRSLSLGKHIAKGTFKCPGNVVGGVKPASVA